MTAIDERIAEGMREQLATRRALLDEGERHLGWKVGFGSPAAARMLGIDRPLVGFLLERGLLPDGGEADVAAWKRPMLEPEIAVRMAADVPQGAPWDVVRGLIGGLAPAIELADVDPPPSDVRAVLAGNIFHRHVVLGPFDETRSTGEGIGARVTIDGAEVAATGDASEITGELVEVVRLTAELLDACGEQLRAGDVVITGSAVAPVPIAPGQRVEAQLGPLGSLAVVLGGGATG